MLVGAGGNGARVEHRVKGRHNQAIQNQRSAERDYLQQKDLLDDGIGADEEELIMAIQMALEQWGGEEEEDDGMAVDAEAQELAEAIQMSLE